MRKFLLIFACALSFCVHGETNVVVELTQEQYSGILSIINFLKSASVLDAELNSNGSLSTRLLNPQWANIFRYITENQVDEIRLLHQLIAGNMTGSWNPATNNILAYASSLRSHNEDVRELLSSMESEVHSIAFTVGGFPSQFVRQYDLINTFHSDYTNNFDRLYDAITNIDFKVSISNQIDLLQVMNGSISNNFDFMQDWAGNQQANFGMVVDHMHRDHDELMDFLHSLSNSVLFASNLCNCCSGSNSNYYDSVLAMLNWMTNNFPDVAESPIFGGSGGSNNVWSIWRPDVPTSAWNKLFVPTVAWEETNDGNHSPFYGDFQYDSEISDIWEQYLSLLENYRTDGIDGQQFLAGLVDLQLHIMANMSTQLYMIDSKMPTKTNLWEWIEQYKSEVQERVIHAQYENSSAVSTASGLLDYTPFSMVGGHFPKVSRALNSLRVDNDSSPAFRIPIPRALRVSDSDELLVDVRESEWFTTGRNWCRWIFTFIWGWLFIRIGLIPIFYIFFFTVRIAEISAHLVFMGSVRGSSGIVSSFGASAVDMVLSLLGIDTDFKRFVWGIMRD